MKPSLMVTENDNSQFGIGNVTHFQQSPIYNALIKLVVMVAGFVAIGVVLGGAGFDDAGMNSRKPAVVRESHSPGRHISLGRPTIGFLGAVGGFAQHGDDIVKNVFGTVHTVGVKN